MAKTKATNKQPGRSIRRVNRPWINTAIVILLLAALIGSILYAVMLMGEIRRMRENTDAQRQMLTEQMELSRRGLDLTRQMLESVSQTKDIAQQQLDISERLLLLAEEQGTKLNRSLTIQEQLLAAARATLGETREMNRRFQAPPSTQSFISN